MENMRVLISFPTDIGIFDIGQSSDRKYHPIFNDESLGSFDSVQDAVDILVKDLDLSVKDPESGKEIKTSSLGISDDYTQWDSAY